MTAADALPILDGHNDALLRLYLAGPQGRSDFLVGGKQGHIDLPRARAGGLAGGFFAIYVPPDPATPPGDEPEITFTADGYEVRMAPAIDRAYAQPVALAMAAGLFRLAAESHGQVSVVRSVDELESCLRAGVLAAILHLEGAEAIDPELCALDVLYQAGLRSLGPVWSRPNLFGHGVPFRFPRSPDTGPGLSEAGRELVRACNRLGVMIDLSHLNEHGFWEVAALSDAPLVATHCNVHALCPSTRNLTDRQLDAIRESDGLVGVAFDVSMLRADGDLNVDTPLEDVVRHVDYLAGRLGIERVGLGSDFDGATMPRDLTDAGMLPNLVAELRRHGYDDAALRKIAHENWLRVLRQTWRT